MSDQTQVQKIDIDLIRKFSSVKIVFFLASAFVIQVTALSTLKKLDTSWVEPPAEKIEKWSPDLFRTFSFGQVMSGIDLIWLRVLQDDAISHVHEGLHPAVYYDLDLATDLDPAFLQAYIGGANLLAVIRDDGPGARDLLLKGEKFRTENIPDYPENFKKRHWSGASSLSMLLAYTYLFELNDMLNAKKYFNVASQLPGSPTYVQNLVRRLDAPGGEYEVGMKLLDFLAKDAKDDRTQEGFDKKKKSLFLGELLFQINNSFTQDLLKNKIPAHAKQDSNLMSRYWADFCTRNHKPQHDPFGGKLAWDPVAQKIVSSTPHQKVFGLD